jgi:hypothetical protein
MTENSSDYNLFVTEFPKKGYKLVDYLQGRVHFALLDQMKLMHTSGMTSNEIKTTIIANITEIIDRFEPEKESESS